MVANIAMSCPCFIKQFGHSAGWNTATIHDQFQPIFGFINFFETVACLGNELGLGAGAGGFAIICTDRRSRTQDLPAGHLCDRVVPGQFGVHTNDPKRKRLCSYF